jgi:hypothetical protein
MTKSARFQIELLSAKLEASELRHTLARRNAVITQLELELKECSSMLQKQRLPPRIKVSSTQRQQLAAGQKWKCVGGESCPLLITNEGLFTAGALYEVDHVLPWSESGKNLGNLRCLCPHCHAVVTRQQCQERVEARFE